MIREGSLPLVDVAKLKGLENVSKKHFQVPVGTKDEEKKMYLKNHEKAQEKTRQQ